METILKKPGLHHIAEDTFLNLDGKTLSNCTELNQNSKEIIDKPMFWLKKFSQQKVPLNDIEPWKALVQKLNDSNLEQQLAMKLKEMYNSGNRIAVRSQYVPNSSLKLALQTQYVPNIKLPLILALQMAEAKENQKLIEFILENVDPKNQVELAWNRLSRAGFRILHTKQKMSPMHIAANFGYIDVVKNLIQKSDNPNAANDFGITPIHLAARQGHLGIVDALMVSVENPNIPENSGNTPVHFAAIGGNRQIVESLKLFTDNLNKPNTAGDTPSKYAKINGHHNLSSFLENGSNPNLPKRIWNWSRKNTKLVALLLVICFLMILFLSITTFIRMEETRRLKEWQCQKSTVFIELHTGGLNMAINIIFFGFRRQSSLLFTL